MTSILTVRGLHKRFGALDVLKGIDLSITEGLVTAIVGHNGSGKTTLIKSMLGLVRPDRGAIHFGGEEVGAGSAYRNRMGYMAQSARFPENLTVLDLFDMLQDLRGGPAPRCSELVAAFRLAPELRKPVRTLSGGNRQKAAAVMAFMFEPDVLILDEPTAGLDPVSSSVLKDLIAAERDRGRSIILTSHIMSELEELADRIVFLQDGLVRFSGNVDAVRHGAGEQNLERAIARLMIEEAA